MIIKLRPGIMFLVPFRFLTRDNRRLIRIVHRVGTVLMLPARNYLTAIHHPHSTIPLGTVLRISKSELDSSGRAETIASHALIIRDQRLILDLRGRPSAVGLCRFRFEFDFLFKNMRTYYNIDVITRITSSVCIPTIDIYDNSIRLIGKNFVNGCKNSVVGGWLSRAISAWFFLRRFRRRRSRLLAGGGGRGMCHHSLCDSNRSIFLLSSAAGTH